MKNTESKWQSFPKSAAVLLLMASLVAAVAWMKPDSYKESTNTQLSRAEYHEYDLVPADYSINKDKEKPDKRPPRRGRRGHHHGPPPPPPGIPPTVLFLIGGALGFLIGRKGHRPPPPPPHYRHDK